MRILPILILPVALNIMASASVWAGGAAPDGKAPSYEKAERHQGAVTMTKAHHFETVFNKDAAIVYIYGPDQSPRMVEGAKGKAVLKYKDGSTKEVALVSELPAKGETAVYFCPMHADVVQMEPGECAKCGGMKLYTQNRLAAKVDLSKARPGDVKVTFSISGLSKEEPEVTFTETYASVPEKKAENKGPAGEKG